MKFFLFFLATSLVTCCFMIKPSKKQYVESQQLTRFDTAFFINVNDSLQFNYEKFLNIKINILTVENNDKLLKLEIINTYSSHIFFDTTSLDQIYDDSSYSFVYNPDINCHVPLQFHSINPLKTLKIENTLAIPSKIDKADLVLFGSPDILALAKQTLGSVDTFVYDREPIYRLNYECFKYQLKNLFYITFFDIPLNNKSGKVKVLIQNVPK